MLVPSYNASRPSITDGSDHVRPATLRGLGPDQVLILVNGKRRHTSALVHVNGSAERGYLKAEGNIATDDANTYSWDNHQEKVSYSDGKSVDASVRYGFKFGEGLLYTTAEYRNHNYTNRSGMDPRQQYFTINGAPDPREATFDRINHRFGDGELEDISLFINGSFPLKSDMKFYTFGGISRRDGLSGGYYRRSLDNRDVRAIYPDGFLPKIKSRIYDGSLAAGLKGTMSGWSYDLSETFGTNSFNFGVANSLNTSFGTTSKREFNAGTLKFSQATSNFDLFNLFDIGSAFPLSVALGAEFRWENYQIVPGEYESYADGGVPILDGPNAGKPAPVGSQVFPGFSDRNKQNQSRTNIALYADLENNITARWLVGMAGRFENYSDFGSTITGKIDTRFELTDALAIRGAVSNGFRAPSLAQSYYSAISTNFISGVPFEIGTFPVNNPIAKALGAKDLKAEKSINLSGGITYNVSDFSLSIDIYQIKITDRIVFTENFTGNSVKEFLATKGINASGGRYFTNAVNTTTNGADITARYGIDMKDYGTLRLTLAMNFNCTEITNKDQIITPIEIRAITSTPLFGRVEQGRFEKGQPDKTINFMLNYNRSIWNLMIRTIRFGEVTTFNRSNPLRDQTFSGKWVTDAEISLNVTKALIIAVGGNNVLDVYPDKNVKANSFNGIFPYNGSSPFGFDGRYVYTRLEYKL